MREIHTPDAVDWAIINALQDGLPLVSEPYATLAAAIGIETNVFLNRLTDMKVSGILRHVSGVVHHRKVGVSANALCLWRVAPERLDEVGAALGESPHVSHCYARTPLPEWPYNLYAMLHAATRGECEAIADGFERDLRLPPRRMLYSVHEWKKSTVHYGHSQI